MLARSRKFRAIRQRRHRAAYGVCHCRFADFLAEKVAQSGALRQICVVFIRKSLSESRYLVDVNTFLVILPWIILLNNGHSIGRRNSDLAHEISHALLAHPPTQPFDHTGNRSFDKDMEDEANCLAGYILIPNEAAQKIVWSGHDPEAACDEYGVSRRMLDFRLNTSGARKRRSRWQQRWSIQTEAP